MRKELFVLVFAAAGLASAIGTPHLLVSRTCGMAFGHCTLQDVECFYVGIQGYRRAFPVFTTERPLSCPGVAMLPLEWPLFHWAKS